MIPSPRGHHPDRPDHPDCLDRPRANRLRRQQPRPRPRWRWGWTALTGHRPRVGWCVRLDWPDGTHTLAAFHSGRARADHAIDGLARYWSAGPLSPTGYRVVAVSRHDWRLHAHRRRCAGPDCPTPDHPTSTDPRDSTDSGGGPGAGR
jgi:hypothetical protein